LDLDRRPKGLIPFHSYPDRSRTAFEEHLVEAAAYTRGADGRCRLHFTVSPEHLTGFEELLDRVGEGYAERLGARFEVGFSVQKPRTDTLAADEDGRPLHDSAGRLHLRPGGHGSLIENLNDLRGDLVFVKNIDNVQPDRSRSVTVEWKKLLAGYLVKLEREASSLLRLNRPLRVCGVVPNTGEPGGGPFWVRHGDGTTSRQIVETAQVDASDDAQQRLLRSSTHFNPVDLVCAVRDADGKPHDLREFVDQEAVIITRKTVGGREVRALERPGLWNGGMAGWNTVFVEVPLETFTPVKTVLDLLRPEHQA
jgi:hypothetical protein